jgi:3-hydroxybutyryl-CoA dehydrogenase
MDPTTSAAAPDAGTSRTAPVLGVVGAGTMGSGIAQLGLEAGLRVMIHDPDPAAVERARERIADGIARRTRRRSAEDPGLVERTVAEAIGRLEESPVLEHLARAADIVIEAALEDLAVKRGIFALLDAAAEPGTILATNTSALSVGAIAAATARPERVIGLHFFNPAPVMALVEVVAPPVADPAVVRAATELVTSWGKTPVRSADSPGFIVNRVNRPFTLEALALLEEGLGSVESIDGAVRAAGYPMGPFELMDLVGIDINLAAARGIYQAFRYEPRFRPSPIQERLVEAGRLGRKSREGFYWYGDDGRSLGQAGAFAADPTPAAVAMAGILALPGGGAAGKQPVETDPVLAEPIVERIVLAVVNEAYRALGDGVASADDIDLALRLGAGHPAGPFERSAALGGPTTVVARLERLSSAGPRFVPAPTLLEAARAARAAG